LAEHYINKSSEESPQGLKALEADASVLKWQHTLMQERVYALNRRDETLDDCFFSRTLASHNCINKGLCGGNLVEKWCKTNHNDANGPMYLLEGIGGRPAAVQSKLSVENAARALATSRGSTLF
jgi:hypothetical protein